MAPMLYCECSKGLNQSMFRARATLLFTEPKRVYPFLEPLVDELLKLWDGVSIESGIVSSFTLRAALLCFISDIPATRKVCGFQGFKARLGYSKCLKEGSIANKTKLFLYSTISDIIKMTLATNIFFHSLQCWSANFLHNIVDKASITLL